MFSKKMFLIFPFLVFSILFFTPLSHADSFGESIHLDLSANTVVPVSFGAQLNVEFPSRFLLQTDIGFMPELYYGTIAEIVEVYTEEGDPTAKIIRTGIEDIFLWSISGGWRPFENLNLEILAGYTVAFYGGGASSTSIINAVTGRSFPTDVGERIPIESTIQAVHCKVGWRWHLYEDLVLRTWVAYYQAVASKSKIDASHRIDRIHAEIREIEEELDKILDESYKKYLKIPALGISIGYRF